MSRQGLRETADAVPQRWQGAAARAGEAYAQFRESRLYVQVVLSAALLGSAVLVTALPVGPLARARSAVVWVATADYDFRGQAAHLNAWAGQRGGWTKALGSVWVAGIDQAKSLVDLPEPAPLPSPPPGATSPQAAPTPPAEPSTQPSPQSSAPAPQSAAEAPARPILPVNGPVLFEFGWPPPGGGDQFHHGIDLVVPTGTKVVAVADGTVVSVVADEKLGKVVEIRHGNMLAVYAQLDGMQVRKGDQVKQGDTIGVVASPSGIEKALPAHLHFEVRIWPDRNSVDPASYLGLGGRKL